MFPGERGWKMKHVVRVCYKKDGVLHSEVVDVETGDLEVFRLEFKERTGAELVLLTYWEEV